MLFFSYLLGVKPKNKGNMKRKKQTISVLFWLRKGRAADNAAPLFCRVTIAGQRYEIPTNLRINPASWSTTAQRVLGRSAADKEANHCIERMQNDIEETVLKIQKKNAELTIENFRLNYQAQDNEYSTLKTLFDYHKIIKGKNLSTSTNWQYDLTLRHLLNFVRIKYNLSDYPIDTINKVFVQEFFAYLQGFKRADKKKYCTKNGALKHIQRFSKVMKIAFDNEWISRNPVTGLGEYKDKVEVGFLTEEEIKSIVNVQLPPYLAIARDEFLFSIYTGTPYGDMCELTNRNISLGIDHTRWLKYTRKKTGERVSLPLLEPAEALIEKYQSYHGNKPDGKLFPMCTNQVINRFLKEIAKRAKVHKKITFHMGRHTFATTITLEKGIPIETVSKMLGHTKLSTTQVYAKVVDTKIMEDMASLKTLYNSKTENNKKKINNL